MALPVPPMMTLLHGIMQWPVLKTRMVSGMIPLDNILLLIATLTSPMKKSSLSPVLGH